MLLTVFDMPEKSNSFPRALTEEKTMHIFTRGSMNASKKPSIKVVNNIIVPFESAALDKFPFIIYIDVISGEKAVITLQSTLI